MEQNNRNWQKKIEIPSIGFDNICPLSEFVMKSRYEMIFF